MNAEEILNQIRVNPDHKIVLVEGSFSMSNFCSEWKNSLSKLSEIFNKKLYQNLSLEAKEICKIFTEDRYQYLRPIQKKDGKILLETPQCSINIPSIVIHLARGESYKDLISSSLVSYEDILCCLIYCCQLHRFEFLKIISSEGVGLNLSKAAYWPTRGEGVTYHKYCRTCRAKIWMVNTINGWQPFEDLLGKIDFSNCHVC